MSASYFSQDVGRIAGAQTLLISLDLGDCTQEDLCPKAICLQTQGSCHCLLPICFSKDPTPKSPGIAEEGIVERSHMAYDMAELPPNSLRISSLLGSCFTSIPLVPKPSAFQLHSSYPSYLLFIIMLRHFVSRPHSSHILGADNTKP